ncbi:MAG TPA: hypothetical protein VEZ47_07880, partial [Gemmatirosa sp.]|nr:hypothetical protein [Gemmatirosa sp.]
GVLLLVAASASAVQVERARTQRALAGARAADAAPTVLRELLALGADGGAIADTAGVRRLLRRGLAEARTRSWTPARRAQLLEAAARVHLRLREPDSAFVRHQDALVVRRLAAARDGAPGARARARQTPDTAVPAPGALLFVRPPGTVFMVDADGRREVRITDSTDVNNNVAWAPGGRRVLVSRQREPRGIHVVDPDGTGMTQVTAPPPGWADHMPVALGDGVAFVRVDSSGASKLLYRVNLDGTGLTRLTSGSHDDDAAPFPTGDRLAFSRDNDIYVLDLRRSVESRLTHTPGAHKAGVAVSPDGRRIAFSRTDPGRLAQIFVMNVDGSGTRRVSRGDFYEFLPRWSPDGTRIAFTSSRDGTNGVYTMRADGSDVRDVSRTPQALTTRPGTTVLQVSETLWAWMKY